MALNIVVILQRAELMIAADHGLEPSPIGRGGMRVCLGRPQRSPVAHRRLGSTAPRREPVGKGSVLAIKMKPFMGVSEGTEAVSEYEPPHRGRMGKMAPTAILTVEPEGQGFAPQTAS